MSYQLPSAFLQKFTPREIHEAKRAFKAHDRDSAAAVDAAELHTVLQTLGENVTPGQAAVMLRQVALERAGVVSWPEFLHLLYDFRNGAIALDPAALVAAVAISTPVEAAPVAPVAAKEPTPLFPKKASNWPPQEHEQPPAQPAAFAHKAQWPPAGAAPAENAPTTHKAQWPPAGAAATQTATWAKQPASPVKEAPAASTPKAQWPPASPTKGAATSPAKAQWPPASPTKGAASAGGKWPPTRDQRSPSAAKQWPPAREQRSVSTPKQWPPTAQTASVPAAPTAAVPSAPPQWGASAGGAAPGWGDSAKTQWPPAASSSAPTAEKSPVATHKPQWPPASSSTAEKSPSAQKRVQWPPAGAATSESPSPLPPRSPPRSPARSPAKTLIAEENSPSAKLDAHAMSVLQRRASAAATFNANVTIHEVRGTAGGLHSYSQEETVAFTQHINNCLQSDRALASLVPIRTDSGLFTAVRDGVLLCKLINAAVPETIDERAVNLNKREKDMNVYQKTENLNLCINAAKSIGCSVVNIGPDDLLEGKPILVLGLVWQIIKIQLTSTINLKNHPELMRLLLEGETLEEFMKLPPDQILLRWMNYHLKAAGHPKTVTNFSKDLQDAVAYSVLLHHIAPEHCDLCHETVPEDRAAHVIQNARKLGIETFIKPRDITSGNPKLNMSFVAQLFNTCPALDIVEEEMKQLEEILYDDVGDTREERVFRMWINSLAIDEVYINHLFSDLHDGLNILKVLDKIEKGIVSWQKVNLVAPNKFKQVENCNYCVVLGKQLKFSLVNIGGADIYEGAKKMILSIIWQSMRYQQLKLLSSLAKGGQGEITDKDIIDWANAKVRQHGRIQTQIVAFRDPALADALYLLDLVHAVEPRAVNWELIARDAQSDEDKASNAKYAISCAQKIGAAVFLTYEDIVEVKSKMIMTFVASLMAVDMHKLHV